MKELVKKMLTSLQQGFSKTVVILTSRKFLVLAIATYLVSNEIISDVIWATIASAFIGIQGTLDWAAGKVALPISEGKDQ